MLIFCLCIQKVGQPSHNYVGKIQFSNLILTWFTYFLCASTMFKHIFGLIPVTHKDSGVQLNQDNRFWVIQLSKSIFPTKVWACAGYPVHSRHMSPFWFMFLHTYPQHFFKFLTWPLTVVYYKVNYLPVGVRIWFWPNCRIRVLGDTANFLSEIG